MKSSKPEKFQKEASHSGGEGVGGDVPLVGQPAVEGGGLRRAGGGRLLTARAQQPHIGQAACPCHH